MKELFLYFTMGYPDMDTCGRFIAAIEDETVNGIEIGFPSKDPKYDGPEIRRSHTSANLQNSSMDEFLSRIGEKGISAYSLQYYSDISQDLKGNISLLSRHGFSGMIVPDLTTDYFSESESVIAAIQDGGLDFIPFFSAATPDSVMRRQCSLTSSWIYYGIQPSTGINVPTDPRPGASRLRAIALSRRIIFGFGIRNDDDIRNALDNGADGIAVGTILLRFLENRDLEGFVNLVKRMRRILDDYS